jgi:hypothetical protein
METKDYLNKLLKIFDQLDNQIGYLKINPSRNQIKYIQQSTSGTKVISISHLFYDFVEGGFIRHDTIANNKLVISKLLNYNDELILLKKYKYGYEVRVYNIIGELIYHQYIRFYDRTRWYQKWYLTKRFPELVLND